MVIELKQENTGRKGGVYTRISGGHLVCSGFIRTKFEATAAEAVSHTRRVYLGAPGIWEI